MYPIVCNDDNNWDSSFSFAIWTTCLNSALIDSKFLAVFTSSGMDISDALLHNSSLSQGTTSILMCDNEKSVTGSTIDCSMIARLVDKCGSRKACSPLFMLRSFDLPLMLFSNRKGAAEFSFSSNVSSSISNSLLLICILTSICCKLLVIGETRASVAFVRSFLSFISESQARSNNSSKEL